MLNYDDGPWHFISLLGCQISVRFSRLLRDYDRWYAGRAAVAKVQELGLSRENPRVQFAQLKGMADVLSLSLVHAGFRVSKVLPFGSVSDFIPFIVRRAVENRGLLGNTAIDRQCLRCDLHPMSHFPKTCHHCFNSHNLPQSMRGCCLHSGDLHISNEIFVSVVFPNIVMRSDSGWSLQDDYRKVSPCDAYTRVLLYKFVSPIRRWIAISHSSRSKWVSSFCKEVLLRLPCFET